MIPLSVDRNKDRAQKRTNLHIGQHFYPRGFASDSMKLQIAPTWLHHLEHRARQEHSAHAGHFPEPNAQSSKQQFTLGISPEPEVSKYGRAETAVSDMAQMRQEHNKLLNQRLHSSIVRIKTLEVGVPLFS
jgi:hypothetical protein